MASSFLLRRSVGSCVGSQTIRSLPFWIPPMWESRATQHVGWQNQERRRPFNVRRGVREEGGEGLWWRGKEVRSRKWTWDVVKVVSVNNKLGEAWSRFRQWSSHHRTSTSQMAGACVICGPDLPLLYLLYSVQLLSSGLVCRCGLEAIVTKEMVGWSLLLPSRNSTCLPL